MAVCTAAMLVWQEIKKYKGGVTSKGKTFVSNFMKI
jgi:hypothetical protein